MPPLVPGPDPTTPLVDPKPKKHIIFRILKVVSITIGSYLIIGFVLIMINPLFAFVVLYPVFAIQDFWGHQQSVALENKLDDVPKSDIVLPSLLTQSDCVGLIFTSDFRNLNNPRVAPYVERMKPGEFDNVGVCTTSKGNLVVKTTSLSGSDLAEIYIDQNGDLKKLFEVGEIVFEFAEDKNGAVFLLLPKSLNGGVTREAFVYDESGQTFLKVADTADTVKVCQIENPNQCSQWRFKNFPAQAVANYIPADQEKEYLAANPKKTKTSAQLECIKEFTKESGRSSGNLGNIKLVTDLNEEPLYSCVTDPTKKPFDFDIYLFGNEKAGAINETIAGTPILHFYNINYAYFDTSSDNRVISYHLSYPGFDIYNYALDSISYQVFKNIIDEKYKVGELIPDIDNTEAGWSGFTPRAGFTSIKKESYKGTDIYTIKGSTRYKAFLLGKTYILIRYDGYLDAAISEDTADIISRRIVDSKPYVPIKISKLSIPPGEQSFDVVAKAFLSKSLEYAKLFYAKHHNYDQLCADQDFSRATSLLMDQFPTNDYGTNCSSSGQTLLLGVYLGTQSASPSRSMYIDAGGYYSWK